MLINPRHAASAGLAALVACAMLFAACSAEEQSSATSTADAAVEAVDDTAATTATTPATTPATQPETTTTATTAPPPTDPPPTDPPPTDPPPTDPQPTDPPAVDPPTFTSFNATNVSACAAPDVSIATIARMVTLSWEIEGADSVYVAIDNVDGAFEENLPAVGSMQLDVPCPDGNTFYVVAENAGGRTVMEAQR